MKNENEVSSNATKAWHHRTQALRRAAPYLGSIFSAHSVLFSLNLCMRVLRALLPVTALFVGKVIIDEVIRLAHGAAPLATANISHRLLLLVALEFLLSFGYSIAGRIASYFESLLVEAHVDDLSVRLMRQAASLDLSDMENPDLQDRLDRARRRIATRSILLPQLFAQVQDIVLMLSFAAGLLAYMPWLLGLLFLTFAPAFFGDIHFGNKAYADTLDQTADRRLQDYLRALGASSQAAKEIRSFGLADFVIDRYTDVANRLSKTRRRLEKRKVGWSIFLNFIGNLGYFLGYAIIAMRAARGAITVGDLAFLTASLRRTRSTVENLLIGISQISSQALHLDDVLSFLDKKAPPASTSSLAFPIPMRNGFVFESVGFKYPNTQHWAVRHLDFSLQPGELVALVGENGAGKSTIVKLLCRLYEPDEGRILLDGHPLADYDVDQLRENIGVIFQDFVRYAWSASDNIAAGRIDARNDLDRIANAAHRSTADTVIEGLPNQYSQLLGKLFKEGKELSGGQWQKIAVARAYMRGAQIIILDEPTAALDARSEFEAFRRFEQLSQAKTGLIISHRFSTVRMAHRILVLHEGRLLESGTHDELVAARGSYAELFELQASSYR